jgi:hypothetical protein
MTGALEKKDRMGADAWTSTGGEVEEVMKPLEELINREFPDRQSLGFDPMSLAERLVRGILLAKTLQPEFAAAFSGLDEAQLDALLQCFKFENCMVREPMVALI